MNRGNGYNERPPSELLVDLHVYVIPPDLWRDHLHSAANQIINDAISAGFIRVLPETNIYNLREEVEQQIGDDIIPRDYFFLKSVGRCLTRVRPKQEFVLKVKNFLPPQAYSPEIFLLEASAETRATFPPSGASSERADSSRLKNYIDSRSDFSPHKTIPPIGNGYPGQEDQNGYLPPLSATPPQSPTHPHSGGGRNFDNEAENRRMEDNLRQQQEELERRKRELEEIEREQRKKEEEDERRRNEEREEAERRRREEEQNRQREEDERRRREEDERRSKEEEEDRRREAERRKREEEEEERRQDEERRRKEEEEQRKRQEEERKRQEEEERRQEEEERSRSPPGPKRMDTFAKNQEKAKLQAELDAAKRHRKEVEKKREELVKRAKQLQAKTQQKRNQARDVWKKKYFDEKKKTPPLEEKCNKLRQDLDNLHKRIMSQLEGTKEKGHVRRGAEMPSETSNLKIQATRTQHEIEDLQRRVENVKMKLTAEMKLRGQAETELRALRAELTQKKIDVTLTRQADYQQHDLYSPRSSQDLMTSR